MTEYWCIYSILFWFLSLFQVMLNEDSDEFPIFHNMQTLDLHSCFRDQYELYDKLEALGSFLQSTPCLEKLVLQYCMVRVLVLHSASCFRWFTKMSYLHGSLCLMPKVLFISWFTMGDRKGKHHSAPPVWEDFPVSKAEADRSHLQSRPWSPINWTCVAPWEETAGCQH